MGRCCHHNARMSEAGGQAEPPARGGLVGVLCTTKCTPEISTHSELYPPGIIH